MGVASHLRCDGVVEAANDYLGRSLSSHHAERIEQHLLICSGCADYVSQLRDVIVRSRALAPQVSEPAGDDSTQQSVESFRRWLRKDAP